MNEKELTEKTQKLQKEISELNRKMNLKEKELLDLRKEWDNIYNPHAVIPIKFSSLKDWEENTKYKKIIQDNIFKNKSEAERHHQLYDDIKDHFKIVKV